jgi:uncharacterized protein with gpF-like domain
MKIQGIDEVSIPQWDFEKYIEEYFAPMRINEEEREQRKQASRDFRDYLLTLFLLIGIQSEYIAVNWAVIEEEMRIEFERAALRYANNSQMLRDYIADKASEFVRITKENIDKGEYWVSDERATYEAVNEANEVFGIGEYQDAVESGMKWKEWITQRDPLVRKSHREVDGKKIPINDYFVLEKGLMLYPSDYENCPAESYGCRCVAKYTKA